MSAIPAVIPASYPGRSGNLVRPLIDGAPAFRRICEAIEAAHRSVWVTVTFMWASFEMPDGRGTALDLLRKATVRGLDVRLICWRPDRETEHLKENAFWGSQDHFNRLRTSGAGIRIRWDQAQPGFAQHQKVWLIDAGERTETAFIGSMNLNPHSIAAPGHSGEGQNLAFPTAVPGPRGDAVVQIQRTVHSGRYTDGRATPQGSRFDIRLGERTNLHQYSAAIEAAQRSVYLENGAIAVTEIIRVLQRALQRGVEITILLTADQELSSEVLALARYDNFTLAGIAGVGFDGKRKPVTVQAKLMIVDDIWLTVGSCNIRHGSLFGSCELNAACWHPETARALRVELLQEHLDQDTSGMDDRSAFRCFRGIAISNRKRLDIGDNAWQGLVFSVVPPVKFAGAHGSAHH